MIFTTTNQPTHHPMEIKLQNIGVLFNEWGKSWTYLRSTWQAPDKQRIYTLDLYHLEHFYYC